jgi:23S rRNA pseudouridine2605 synthase
MSEERVQKLLSQSGFGSRRTCEGLIEQGRVTVNGSKVILWQKADIERDTILVDGKPIRNHEEYAILLLISLDLYFATNQ